LSASYENPARIADLPAGTIYLGAWGNLFLKLQGNRVAGLLDGVVYDVDASWLTACIVKPAHGFCNVVPRVEA
jgi:hypothetical protein